MVNCENGMDDASESSSSKSDIYLNALESFNTNSSRLSTPILDEYLLTVALTGRAMFPWDTIRKFVLYKLETVMTEMSSTAPYDDAESAPNTMFCDSKTFIQRIVRNLEAFDGIPFTMQRLAELLSNPHKHYKRADKFFRALEKNVIIVTTVSPGGERETRVSPINSVTNHPPSDDVLSRNNGDNRVSTPAFHEMNERSADDDAPTPVKRRRSDDEAPTPMPSIETLWEATVHNGGDHDQSVSSTNSSVLLDTTEVNNIVDAPSLEELDPTTNRLMMPDSNDNREILPVDDAMPTPSTMNNEPMFYLSNESV